MPGMYRSSRAGTVGGPVGGLSDPGSSMTRGSSITWASSRTLSWVRSARPLAWFLGVLCVLLDITAVVLQLCAHLLHARARDAGSRRPLLGVDGPRGEQLPVVFDVVRG